uniref:Ferritin n=2 Tax=Canis lupus familiaris TaxID=9615 RepID=A0A8P0P4X7_CANLF
QAQAQGPLSEACGVAINYIASYELNVSDGYLSMVCYFDEDPDAPVYVPFFQDEAEVKKGHARQFIRYLKERKSKVCLPVVKRLDKEYWGTNVQAIVMALELENELHKLLQDLQNLTSQKNETDLLEFLKRFVGKRKRNIKYLEYQHSYQKELERLSLLDYHRYKLD